MGRKSNVQKQRKANLRGWRDFKKAGIVAFCKIGEKSVSNQTDAVMDSDGYGNQSESGKQERGSDSSKRLDDSSKAEATLQSPVREEENINTGMENANLGEGMSAFCVETDSDSTSDSFEEEEIGMNREKAVTHGPIENPNFSAIDLDNLIQLELQCHI